MLVNAGFGNYLILIFFSINFFYFVHTPHQNFPLFSTRVFTNISTVIFWLTSTLSYSLSLLYLFAGPCPQGTFACDGNTLCVPQRQICDNRTDCEDGSDEHPVECGLLYGSKALTDKIVGNAIERRRQQQRQKQQQQSKTLSSGRNGTAGELINVTTVGVTSANIDTENGGRLMQMNGNEEVAICGKYSFKCRFLHLRGGISQAFNILIYSPSTL